MLTQYGVKLDLWLPRGAFDPVAPARVVEAFSDSIITGFSKKPVENSHISLCSGAEKTLTGASLWILLYSSCIWPERSPLLWLHHNCITALHHFASRDFMRVCRDFGLPLFPDQLFPYKWSLVTYMNFILNCIIFASRQTRTPYKHCIWSLLHSFMTICSSARKPA